MRLRRLQLGFTLCRMFVSISLSQLHSLQVAGGDVGGFTIICVYMLTISRRCISARLSSSRLLNSTSVLCCLCTESRQRMSLVRRLSASLRRLFWRRCKWKQKYTETDFFRGVFLFFPCSSLLLNKKKFGPTSKIWGNTQ